MLRTYQPKKLHRKKEHGFRKDCLKESNKSCGRNRPGDFAKGKWIAPVREVIHRYGFKQNISDNNISKSKERGSTK